MLEIFAFGKDRTGAYQPFKTDRTGGLRPSYDFRDIVATGTATPTNAQETTLITGIAGSFIDVVTITGTNSSTSAILANIRMSTGGGVVDTLSIPAASGGANGVVSKQYTVPLTMNETGAAVTVQNGNTGEISDSALSVTAIAVRNT